MTDEELYGLLHKKSKKVSKKAFDELYNRYSVNIYSYCRRVFNNELLIEDIFQETFIRFYESAKDKREMTNVAGFLIKIARNLCLNEKSKKYFDNISLDDLQLPSYDASYDKKQMNELLQTALDALPKKYREVIILKEFLDMSYQEIADTLDLTLSVVRIRIFRAKAKLKELLKPYFNEFENY